MPSITALADRALSRPGAGRYARWFLLGSAAAACAAALLPQGTRPEAMMLAIGVSAVISSLAGFAFAAISGAMLLHLASDPVEAVQVIIVCSIANQTAMTWAMRRHIEWHGLGRYVVAGLTGLPWGVWLLLHLDRGLYCRAVGGVTVAYGLYMLLRRPVALQWQPRAIDLLAGFVGGITGGALGFPSSAISVWLALKGWDKMRQRALLQPYILILQVAALVTMRVAGGPSSSPSLGALLFVPASLVGTAIGFALFKHITDRQFGLAVNLGLVISGLGFLV